MIEIGGGGATILFTTNRWPSGDGMYSSPGSKDSTLRGVLTISVDPCSLTSTAISSLSGAT